jgi:hypothetical protein
MQIKQYFIGSRQSVPVLVITEVYGPFSMFAVQCPLQVNKRVGMPIALDKETRQWVQFKAQYNINTS